MLSIKKLYLPLILVELYLLFTVWLLYYGPMVWPIENEKKFLILISLYHLFFICGYLSYVFLFSKRKTTIGNKQPLNLTSSKFEDLILNKFWTIVFLSFLCSIIAHRNITHSSSYIPWDFFSNLEKGITDPAGVRNYYASDAYSANFKGNKYITSVLLLLSVFKYALLPILIFLWPRLGFVRRFVGSTVVIIPLASGISISLSSINFSYLFITAVCFFVLFLTKKSRGCLSIIKDRKFVAASFIFLFLFSFWQFYSVKSGITPYQMFINKQRPVTFEYLETNNVKFKHDFKINDKDFEEKIVLGISYDFYQKITSYLVQGYVGMSIALGEKFESSYGLGHSVFLQRVFDKHLGFNLAERSFQHKITKRWDENIYWHSAYSYFANDVGFFGVCFVMLVLGFYFAMVFALAVIHDNFIAKLLLPLFAILFFYIPANNQVFSFLETMSSFWILTILFIVLNYISKMREAKRILNIQIPQKC